MGKVFEGLRGFIAAQHMFFVATAPLSADGHVNLSPKGLDTFRVLGPNQVAYLDLVGERTQFLAWARQKGESGIARYKTQENRKSIDGLPGLRCVGDE